MIFLTGQHTNRRSSGWYSISKNVEEQSSHVQTDYWRARRPVSARASNTSKSVWNRLAFLTFTITPEVIMPYNHKQTKICWNNILHLHFLHPSSVIDKNGELVKLVPVPVPIPVPVYIPVPMHLYTQYTPFPLGLTLPVCHLCNYLKWFCAIVYSYSWIILHCYHPGACSHGHPWISRCCRTERH